MFCWNPSGSSFLAPKAPVYVKNQDFRTPCGFREVPTSALGAPFFAKMSTCRYPAARGDASWSRAYDIRPPQNTLDHIFIDLYVFWTDLGQMLMDLEGFLKILGRSMHRFWYRISNKFASPFFDFLTTTPQTDKPTNRQTNKRINPQAYKPYKSTHPYTHKPTNRQI